MNQVAKRGRGIPILRASFAGVVAGKEMWQVDAESNYYLVYDGRYTAHRMRAGGQVANYAIMHPRFAGLREKIDAAIARATAERPKSTANFNSPKAT